MPHPFYLLEYKIRRELPCNMDEETDFYTNQGTILYGNYKLV